jgi:putative ABC transport system permease protein
MKQGKWWDEGEQNKVVLNEEAVRVMGLQEPIGAVIRKHSGFVSSDGKSPLQEYEVTGVVNDFHTLSLRSRIYPTLFSKETSFDVMYIRVIPGKEQEVMKHIKTLLSDIDVTLTDARLTPLDELYDRLNSSEQVGLKIFALLAVVCLLISLFGIYAVATASTQRRRKEIAIRKVVGAESRDIIRIFFREHIMQVIIAGVVALPVVYLAMNRWLQGYAYHTDIPWWLLTGVVAVVIIVVLLTVLGQILKAAHSNPAEVVKSE